MQIKKYLNGELDAKAMHQLERQTLDDPFLMDALEGYEQANRDQGLQLAAISARLQERISANQKKILPLYFMAIAASVLIVFTVGGLLLVNHQSDQKQRVASLEKTLAPLKPDSIQKATTDYKKPSTDERADHSIPRRTVAAHQSKATGDAFVVQEPVVVAESKATAPNTETAADETASPEEMVVLGMQSSDKKTKEVHIRNKAETNPNTLLETKVPGVTKTEGTDRSEYNTMSRNLLQGRVFARDNGLPLTGASVRLEGTNKTAVTDVEGKFTIPFDSNKQSRLLVASIGYETLEVVSKNRDSLKAITLEPNSSSLNEVVVTGYSTANKTTAVDSLIKSHPKAGWSDFRKYLRKNAVSSDGKAGVVKLSFQVNHDGSITGITVTKSLSASSDQKAIDLINNGPEWLGNKNGLPETVEVRVKFEK